MRESWPAIAQILKSNFHGNVRLITFRVSSVSASTESSHIQGVTLMDMTYLSIECGSGFVALEKNGKDGTQSEQRRS